MPGYILPHYLPNFIFCSYNQMEDKKDSNEDTGTGHVSLSDIEPTINPGLGDHLLDYAYLEFSDDSDSPLAPPPINNGIYPVNHSTGDNPSKVEFQGDVGFSLHIDNSTTSQKWLFSPSLKKLFIRLGEVLPISFKLAPGTRLNDMFIRAVMVYDSSDNCMHPVERCPLHSRAQHKINEGYQFVNHVLFCADRHAQYSCNEESKRYSVMVPFGEPQPGATYLTFVYGFKCKSSCEGGMNRRNTSIIFTLEHNGEVKGRQVLKVRICGSPGRDLKIEEESKANHVPTAPRGRKRKLVEYEAVKEEVDDSCPPQTPQEEEGALFPFCLEVRGEQIYKYILQRAADRYMASVLPKMNFYKKLQQEAEKF